MSSSILGRVYSRNSSGRKAPVKQPFARLPEPSTPAPDPFKTKQNRPRTGGCAGYEPIGEKPYKTEADKPVLIGFKCTPESERKLVALAKMNGIRFDSRADMYRWAIEQALGVEMLTPRKRERIASVGPVIVYKRNLAPVLIQEPEQGKKGNE